MRKQFMMTTEDFDTIVEASKPVPMIMLQCGEPKSQQGRANDAWKALGAKMGFYGMTVKPDGPNPFKFTAEATDVPST